MVSILSLTLFIHEYMLLNLNHFLGGHIIILKIFKIINHWNQLHNAQITTNCISTKTVLCLFFRFLYPHHKMWGGGLYWILFVASVGRSVSPSPIRVHSITPLLMEGFPSNLNDTFTSTRGCAEPMLPMCQLKVKVTVKCQILNKQILDIMFCLLCKSYTNEKKL